MKIGNYGRFTGHDVPSGGDRFKVSPHEPILDGLESEPGNTVPDAGCGAVRMDGWGEPVVDLAGGLTGVAG